MNLRDYQQQGIGSIRDAYRAGYKSVLYQAPTGAGKTVMFAFITQNAAAKGNRVYILLHRDEIVSQTSNALNQIGVPHGVISAKDAGNLLEPVQVCSVWTLAKRLSSVPAPNLLIADECHHLVASSWLDVIAAYPTAKLLGVTATPERLDGQGLGKVFQHLIKGPSVSSLIQQGFLAKPIYYAPPIIASTDGIKKTAGDYNRGQLSTALDKPTITGDALQHYRRICSGVPAIAFCCSIEHAEHVAASFREGGFSADTIDGTMTRQERRDRIAALGDGRLQVLTSCDLIGEGLDVPVVTAAILLRPTHSLGLHLQQIGRVLRRAPNKANAIILDHVGNIHRHGLAEDEREWSLEGAKARKSLGDGERLEPIKQCEACFAVIPNSARECPQCATPVEVRAREIEHRAGELVAIDTNEKATISKAQEQAFANDFAALVKLGRQRGYPAPHAWANHILKARKNKQLKEKQYA